MGNLDGFDASLVEPEVGFQPIPAGEYEVIIIDSKLADTKRGDGKILSFTLQITSGEYQNKKLFDRLNTKNPNDVAQRIGKAQLSAICRAVGVLQPKDSTELHMKPLRAKVIVENDATYGIKNVVKGYSPRQGKAQSNPMAVAPAGPANGNPWG